MDKLKDLFLKYHLGWLSALLSLVSADFIYKLIIALRDGAIDPSEYHTLSTGANGIEMLILIALMSVFKKK